MVALTVKALVRGNYPDGAHGCNIYIVRDGDVVFYVGQSHNVIDRLLSHLGLGTWGHGGRSSLGDAIMENAPQSGAWQIELHSANAPTCLNRAYNEHERYLPEPYKDKRRAGVGASRAVLAAFGKGADNG